MSKVCDFGANGNLKPKPNMKRFFAIFSLCAALVLSGCKKDDPAIVDELDDLVEVGELVEFSDSNFKQALISSGYDLNRDGEISVEEALKVTEIIVTGEKIKSLAGLEYFENLEVLQCSDTFLTEIDPFQNTKLREIVCNDTEVTVLDVCACPDIETIYANTVVAIYVVDSDQQDQITKYSFASGYLFIVGNDPYVFPDENFRLALLSSKNNVDFDDNGTITMGEVRVATAIDISPDVATSFTNSLIYNVNSISSISSADTKSAEGTEAATTPQVIISTSENNLVLASAAVTRATGSGAGYVKSMKLDDFVSLVSLNSSGNPDLAVVDLSNNSKIEAVELPEAISVVILSEVQYAIESFVTLIVEAVEKAVSNNSEVAAEDVAVVSTAEGIFDNVDIDESTKSAIESYLINNIKDENGDPVTNGYDTNGDGKISYGESSSIEILELDDASCTISGVNTALKILPNLTTFSFKQSTSAKAELVVMYNPLLEKITMQAPNVSLLNLTANTALTSVDMNGATGVTALNLSYITALKELDITGMAKLTFFGLGEVKQELFEDAFSVLETGSKSTLATLGVSKISDLSSLDLSTLGEFTALSYVAIPDATAITASQWQIDNYTSTWSLASDAVISLDMDQPMVFADAAFSVYAKMLSETDGDSELTPEEAEKVTLIDFQYSSYPDFAGTAIVELKYFTGLTSLNLNGQSTFAATPDFSAEPYSGLTYLNISGTSVPEMDLTKTELLTELYCTTDGIKSLDVSTNAALVVLEAENVKTLTVSQGQYDGMERDAWKLADGCVFETPELLPTDGLKFSSDVFEAYLLANTTINTTDDGVITVAEAAAATAIDLSNLGSEDLVTITKLSELRYFTGLTSLNLSGCTALTAVDLTSCTLLTDVNLTSTGVTTLDISKIVNPAMINAPTVTTVAVSAAQYNVKDTTYAGAWIFDAAVVYEVDGNLYKNVSFIDGDDTNNNLYVVALIAANPGLDSSEDNVVMEVEVEEYAGVLTLPTATDYSATELTEIPQLAMFKNITGVVADNSTITAVDLTENTSVATVELVSTSALSSLTTGTAMTSLTVGDGSALTTLDLSLSTLLTSIEITGAAQLAALDISMCTALQSINITGATTLAALDLSACTALTSIEITGATTLASLTLPAASLTTLNLDGNTALTAVDLRGLTALPAASNFSADASTKLYITGTQAAAITPSDYLAKLAADATAIYPTYDSSTGTLTVVCDSTGDYEVDSYSVPTSGDLLVQINGYAEVKALYDAGVIEKLVLLGTINAGDITTALNHFYEMDFRDIEGIYGLYMGSASAASGDEDEIGKGWPFKPFGSDTTVKKITLSANITSYKNQAVGSCTSIEELVVPSSSATSISWGACTGCTSLSKVTFEGTNITAFAGSTFKGTSLLTQITLPSSLVSMGSLEFQDSGITSIEIPASLVTIGASCFDGCTSLTEVKVNWTDADATFTFTTPETFFPSQFYIGGENYITIPDDYAGAAYDELALTYQMKTVSGGQYYPTAYEFTNDEFAAAVKAVITDPYLWTEAALSTTTALDLSGYSDIANVTDATDLEVFVALETLNLSGAGISELDLSNNTVLTSLTISSLANLATLDISKLGELTTENITAENSALTTIVMTSEQYTADTAKAQALLKSGSETSYIFTEEGTQLYPSTDSNIVFTNGFAASETYTYETAAEATELTVTAGSSLDDLKWFTSLETLTIGSDVTATEINLEDHNSLTALTISTDKITTLDISATQIDEASSLSATYVTTLYTSSTNQGIYDSNYTAWLADTVLATGAVIYVDSAYAYPFKPYSDIQPEIAAKIAGFMLEGDDELNTTIDDLTTNLVDEVIALSLNGDLTDTQIATVVEEFTALTSLLIENNSSMTALNISSLALTELRVSECVGLESVTFKSGATFSFLEFGNCSKLTTLDLSTLGALPTVDSFSASSVTSLTISADQAMSDDDYALYCAKLGSGAKIYVSGNSTAVYPIALYSEDNSAITSVITGFTLSGEAQTDVALITVKNLGDVTALTLSGDLADSYVEQIFTDFENLTSIVMSGNTTVTAIDMSDTSITSVEITGATALTKLTLPDSAALDKLIVNDCTELTAMSVMNITSLPAVDNFSANTVTTLNVTEAQKTAMGSDDYTSKLADGATIATPMYDSVTGTLTVAVSSMGLDYAKDSNGYPTEGNMTEVIATDPEALAAYEAASEAAPLNKLVVTGVINVGDYIAMRNKFLEIDTEGVTGMAGQVQTGGTASTNKTGEDGVITYQGHVGGFSGDATATKITSPSSITSYRNKIVGGATALETAIFTAQSPTNIGYAGCQGCTSLKYVIFAEGAEITTLSGNSFKDCTALETFDMTGITSLGGSTFSGCTSLREIEFEEGTFKTFGASEFSGCTSLTSIEIPASVTTFGATVFTGCTSLTSMTVNWADGSIPASFTTALFDDESALTLNVVAGTGSAYTALGFTNVVDPDSKDVTITNAAVKSYIEENYADYITDGVVAEADIEKITTLDLTGIEDETGLQDDLDQLTGLTTFTTGTGTTYSTVLTSLDFSNNIALESLTTIYNSNLTTITGLDQIATLKSITLNHNSALTEFKLGELNTEVAGTVALQNCSKIETVDITGCTGSITMLNLNNISSDPTVTLTGASGLVQIKGNTSFSEFDVSDCADSFNFNTLAAGAITVKLTLNVTQYSDNKSGVTTKDATYTWTDLLADDALLAVEQEDGETFRYYNAEGTEVDEDGVMLDYDFANTAFDAAMAEAYPLINNIAAIQALEELDLSAYIEIDSYEDVALFTGLTSLKLAGTPTALDITANTELTSLSAPSVTDLTMTIAQSATFVSGGAVNSEAATVGDSCVVYDANGTVIAGEGYEQLTIDGDTMTVLSVASDALTSTQAYEVSYAALAERASTENPTYSYDEYVLGNSDLSTIIGSTDISNVKNIVVTGSINAADVAYLYGKFESIDLSGTELLGYVNYQSSALTNSSSAAKIGEKYLPVSAFDSDEDLKIFKSPSNIVAVGYTAFKGATSLTTVVLSDSTVNLNYQAFYGCTSLSSINLNSAIATIGNGVFYNCSSLTYKKYSEMNLGITQINFQTFYGCTGFEEIDIPEGVTKITEQAFYNCTNVEKASLPSTLTTFAMQATTRYVLDIFCNCAKLTDATVNWASDATITFPSDVDGQTCNFAGTIFPSQFTKDSGSYYVNVPEGCSTQSEGIYATLATKYNLLAEGETPVVKVSFSTSAVQSAMTTLFETATPSESEVQTLSELSLSFDAEPTATDLLDDLEKFTALTSLTLTGEITAFDPSTLSGLSFLDIDEAKITELDLSKNSAITSSAYVVAVDLTKLTLTADQFDDTNDGWYEMLADGGKVVVDGTDYEKPEVVTFKYDYLTETLTVAVDSSGDYSAYNDETYAAPTRGDLLDQIEANDEVKALYEGETPIKNLVVTGTLNNGDVICMFDKFVNVDMRDAVITGKVRSAATTSGTITDSRLPFQAFYGDETLETIVLPSKLGACGNQMLCGAAALTKATIPGDEDVSLTLGYALFMDCAELEEVVLEKDHKISGFGGAVFSGCTSLESFVIGENATSFANTNTFSNCNAMSSLEIKWASTAEPTEGKYTLPTNFKIGNTNGYSITIPDGCTGQGIYATLAETYALTEKSDVTVDPDDQDDPDEPVDPSESVIEVVGTSTGDSSTDNSISGATIGGEPGTLATQFETLLGADYLENENNGKVTITGTINYNDFMAIKAANFEVVDMGGATSKGYMYVSSTGYGNNNIPQFLFSNATSTSELDTAVPNTVLKEFTFPSGAMYLGIGMFANCTALEKVTFPSSTTTNVRNLMNYACYGCTSLTTLVNDNNLTHCTASAFAGCTSLTSIDLSGMTTAVGASAFNGCTNLATVVSLGSANGIGANAFDGTKITTLAIPATVVTLASNMLAGAEYLTSVTLSYDSESVPNISALSNVFPTSFTSSGLGYILVTSGTVDNYTSALGWGSYNIIDDENNKPTATEYDFQNTSFQTAFEDVYGEDKTTQDLAAMGTLDLSDKSDITDFSDLAAFTGLTTLDLSGCTGATDTKLDLSANTALMSLDVSESNFTELTLTANTQLSELIMENSAVLSLDLSTTAMAATGLTASELDNITLTAAQYADSNSGWQAMIVEGGSIYLSDDETEEAVYTKPEDAGSGDTETLIWDAESSTLTVTVNSTDEVDETVPTSGDLLAQIEAHTAANAAYTAGTIDNLVISGTINAGDYTTITAKFKSVDMRGVTAMVGDYYEYAGGGSSVTTVGADEFPMPLKIFYGDSTNNTVLEEIVFPTGITEFGAYLLMGNNALTKVTIPEGSYTAISEGMFQSISALDGDGIIFEDSSEIVTMSQKAFKKSLGLTSYTILSTITEINASTFDSCTNLASVVIPSSVTSIDSSAFSGCTALTSVTVSWTESIPETFTTSLFSTTPTLTVPEGTEATYDDLGFTVEGYTPDSGSGDAETLAWDATNSTLTVTLNSTDKYDNETSVPTTGDLLAQINANADVQTAYTTGTIDKLVLSGVINAGDFADIINHFKEVDFRGITALHGVYAQSGSATNGEAGSTTTTKWPFQPFGSDTTVEKITLSETISGYNNQAIGGCTSIKEVVIPATGATSLGWGACTGCTSLTTVTFEGTNITTLSGSTFKTNTLLKTITLPSLMTTFGTYEFQSSGLTSIDIPSTVTTISSGCFDSCSDLTSVTLNWTDESVTLTSPEGIFPSQFHKDGGSYSINIPDGLSCVAVYDILAETYSLKSGGSDYVAGYVYSSSSFQSAFETAYPDSASATEAELAEITSLTLSDASITDFSDLAVFTDLTSLTLSGCTGCTALDLTANTKLTASSVVVDAGTLSSLRLTTEQYEGGVDTWKAMISAEDGAIFLDDDALATYPEQTISYDATSGTLAVKVNSTAGNTAYDYDTTYTTVPTSGDLLVQIEGNAAAKAAYDEGTIAKLVLSGTINAGDYTTIYRKFNVVDMSGVTQMVGDYINSSSSSATSASTDDTPYTYLPYAAFYPSTTGDTVMTEFVSPQNIAGSYGNIFMKATSLTKATISSGTFTELDWASFSGCSALTTVVFGEDVNLGSIDGQAFLSCSKLVNITIPSTVTSLGNGAFSGCKALTTIDIPVSVTKFVQPTVFENCTGLTNVTVHWESASAIPANFTTAAFGNGAAQALTVPYGTSSLYTALGFTNVTEAAAE